MKRFLFALLLILGVAASAAAQGVKNLIEIDPTSFRPVQSDVLTGVNIDPIGKDRSQRPCARIKLHINRMTPEQINAVQVMPIGGNIVVMKRTLAYEGNGLIIEMTAKPQTRFYIHHADFGDSNEVTVDLEGNKEYFLDAQLNQLYPITVNSSEKGVDVYIDDKYCGKTNEEYYLSVHDVLPGDHTLRVEFAGRRAEKTITVHKESLVFRCNVDTAEARPQYVVFSVTPKDAIVIIEDKSLVPADGVASEMLPNGTYSYSVEAKDYHPQRGTFKVSGQKVTIPVELNPAHGWLSVPATGALKDATIYIDNAKVGTTPFKSRRLPSGEYRVRIVKSMYKSHEGTVTITDNQTLDYAPQLVPDFATVTVTTKLEDCELWIDNSYRGTAPWSGDLQSGTHILELRKAGHNSTSKTETVSASNPRVEIEIPSPTPIYGTLDIKSSPAMAEVYIDGKKVGETPMQKDVIIGKHTVLLRKSGYTDYERTVEVGEGQTVEVNEDMSIQKIGSSISSSTSFTSSTPSTSSTYSPSSNKTKSTRTKKGGFNVGITLGGGYGMLSSGEEGGEFNAGLMWRMWRHDSLLNVMTGFTYMRTFQCNFLSVPVVINLNYIRVSDSGMYSGIGVEPTMILKKSDGGMIRAWDMSIKTHILGLGWRHSDFNIYLKYLCGSEVLTMGCCYTYLF